MPPKPKTPAEIQQLRTLIIDAARHLFVTHGVEAVTMREVAKRIGYSATSIYLHFADKESLIRAVCDSDMLVLAQAQHEIMAIPDPLDRLLALGMGYAKFALSHPNHYRLLFMTPHPAYCPTQSGIQQNNPEQDAYYQLKSVVDYAHQAGIFKPEYDDVELIAQTIWAGMHGVCALEIIMANDAWVDWRSIETRLFTMANAMLNGLAKVKQ
jgi:AcrR family transcriptional regulator